MAYVYDKLFTNAGEFHASVPEHVRTLPEVMECYKANAKGAGKYAGFKRLFGTDWVENVSQPSEIRKVWSEPFSIKKGVVTFTTPVMNPWEFNPKNKIASMALRFITQFTVPVIIANDDRKCEIVDSYPPWASKKKMGSISLLLRTHHIPVIFPILLEGKEGISKTDKMRYTLLCNLKRILTSQAHLKYYVLNLPTCLNHVVISTKDLGWVKIQYVASVVIKQCPVVAKDMIQLFLNFHSGGAQFNSDYLLGHVAKEKYLDSLSLAVVLKSAVTDMSIVGVRKYGFLPRIDFPYERDLHGNKYDQVIDWSAPTQVSTSERNVERAKRCEAMKNLYDELVAFVRYIDELTHDYILPDGWAYAHYPAAHAGKVIIFDTHYFTLTPVTLVQVIARVVYANVLRSLMWGSPRVISLFGQTELNVGVAVEVEAVDARWSETQEVSAVTVGAYVPSEDLDESSEEITRSSDESESSEQGNDSQDDHNGGGHDVSQPLELKGGTFEGTIKVQTKGETVQKSETQNATPVAISVNNNNVNPDEKKQDDASQVVPEKKVTQKKRKEKVRAIEPDQELTEDEEKAMKSFGLY